MDKVKFVLAGVGNIGKRHASIIMGHPEAELIAIADIDKGLSRLSSEWMIPFFSSLEDVFLAGIRPDVVSICTPNGLHASHALLSLENKAHVLCEKPMALRKSDGERIIAKSLEKSRNVFCVMQNRYSPPAKWLKQVIEDNSLGKIFMVQVNCYWNRDERYYLPKTWRGTNDLDGGTLFTQFSHFIDMLYWLFGDIQNISARFADFNHKELTEFEDSGMVNFEFQSGGMGSIHYSTAVWNENLESSLTIVAENGSIKIGGQYMERVECCNVKGLTKPELPPSNPPNDYGAYKGSASNHQYVIDNVIDTISGRSSIGTNALEGLKVVEIIEKIYALKSSIPGNISNSSFERKLH